MTKISKPFAAILILVALAGFVGIVRWVSSYGISQDAEIKQARVRGNPKAKLKISEFIDFQCPACALGAKELKSILEAHPDQIFLELKYFPLQGHRFGFRSAMYGECVARQGKFWPFFDVLIERQSQWSTLISAEPVFQQIAKDAELDMTQLDSCLGADEVKELILKEKSDGQALGVKSTPTYFINGKMVVGVKLLKDEINAYFAAEPKAKN